MQNQYSSVTSIYAGWKRSLAMIVSGLLLTQSWVYAGEPNAGADSKLGKNNGVAAPSPTNPNNPQTSSTPKSVQPNQNQVNGANPTQPPTHNYKGIVTLLK